jgi:acetylornithine/LysW-gamma-L-lysine aminotransferase
MNTSEIQMIEDAHLARFYARKPIAIVNGRGAVVFDADGREYVDCAGGYGTCIVGHAHPAVAEAIAQQSHKLISCHGSTYNDARANLLSRLASILPSGFDRVFLSNSGAEAIECAIKLARKSTGRRKIVAMKGGYHGKTHGALSATWDKKYRKSFEPLDTNFAHIPFGDFEGAKSAVSNDTAAVLVEPIQGEGGIRVPPPDWLPLLKDLTQDASALLIADEIQTGFGRTGQMFACNHFGVTSDIMCLGKGIASGLPLGVTAASEATMGSMGVGEHSSTFGGNPVVCAAATATINVLLEEQLVQNAAKVGAYFKDQLQNMQRELRIIREVRGLGLMLGTEMRFDVYSILQSTLQKGVLMLDAGRNVLRFLPPLCIQQEHVTRVMCCLRSILVEEQVAKLPG